VSVIDLYAVLGVPRDAGVPEIEAAWRTAVAGLGPTDPSFRVFNQAGEVLLDARRRERYDADLAAAEDSEVEETLEPASSEPTDSVFGDGRSEPEDAVRQAVPGVEAAAETPSDIPGKWLRGSVPTWLLALLTALVIAIGAAAISLPDDLGRALPDRSVPSAVDTASDAVRAAEQALPEVLEYNYRTLSEDRKAATSRMTPSYAKEYAKLFDTLVKDNAAANKTVITARVIGSAVNQIKRDQVDVMLFVDQNRIDKAHPTPTVYRAWVTLEMVRSGSGWQVGNMRTTKPA
jgi:Mce-associated membrane protein